MANEIELKAWVDEPERIQKTLSQISKFEFKYVKEDAYWFPVNGAATAAENTLPKSGIRVRKETTVREDCCDVGRGMGGNCGNGGNGKETFTLVTYKTKEVRGDIEVNKENEFIICAPQGASTDASDDASVDAFEQLLKKLNLKVSYTKKKEGYSYKRILNDAARDGGEITAELSFVENLGWFLELEIISEHDDEATIAGARSSLMSFLKEAGIDDDKIETRYYSEMLAQKH